MAQTAVPNSLVSAAWVGTAAGLADANDATYLESLATPTSADTFVCYLSSIADPLIHTAHQLRLRSVLYPSDGDPLSLFVALENLDDSSVVASWTVVAPPALEDTVLTLSEAQAATIHSYSGLRVRGYAELAASVYFVWSVVPFADSYVLQIGTSLGGSQTHNANVGNVLTHGMALAAGTYYSRVVAYQGAVVLSTSSPDQTVVVV